MEAYILALVILALYAAVAVAGHVAGVWKRVGVSFQGPVMLWRTRRGRESMQRVARADAFWRRYSAAGLVVMAAMTAGILSFLLWTGFSSPDLPKASAASEEIGPGLPTDGILATAAYGLAGFVLAVVVHELAHGVVTLWSKVRLESMGVAFLGIPIGAFVEPSDEDLEKAEPEVRARIYAAGPATNIIFAVVCLFLLALVVPEAEPRLPGALVTAVAEGSPAEMAGIGAWTEVTHIGSAQITSAEDLMSHSFDSPGAPVAVNITYGRESSHVLMPQGVAITEVIGGPATNAQLRPGMIIKSLNGTVIHSSSELRSVVENSTHDAPVEITVLERGHDAAFDREWFVQNTSITSVNLTSKWLWYYTNYNWLNEEDYHNQSFLGVATAPFGAKVRDMDHLTDLYSRPYAGTGSLDEAADATVRLVSLPFIGYSPVTSPAGELYEPSGALSFVPNDIYWGLVNLVYWCFWGNLMLGLANAIPALPFDGGYFIRDAMRWGLTKPRKRLTGIEKVTHIRRLTDEGEELLVKAVTYGATVFSLVVVALLILDPLL